MHKLDEVSILNLLPPNLASDPGVIAAARSFDEVLHGIIKQIPNVSIMPRIQEITNSALLDLLAWQFHVDFYDVDLPIAQKQELVWRSLDWHSRKGTPAVVEEAVRTVFDDCTVSEWFEYGGDPYYFRITTAAHISSGDIISRIISMINTVKNTRSWLEKIIVESTYQSKWYFGGGVFDNKTIVINMPIISDQTATSSCFYGGAIYINKKLEVRNG